MPCSVSQAELDFHAMRLREEWTAAGRWDLLATQAQLAGWLCDALRGAPPTDEALRWFQAHQKFHDKPWRG